jgi:hypothetical protein
MKHSFVNWKKNVLPLVAWIWLLLAILALFPVPLPWLARGVGAAFIGTIAIGGQWPRHYLWFLPCLPLIVAWYIPLPLSASLAPLPRLGITIGIWTAIVTILLGAAAYLSQRGEHSPRDGQ